MNRREFISRLLYFTSLLFGASLLLSLSRKPGSPEKVVPITQLPVKVASVEEVKAKGYVKFYVHGIPGILVYSGGEIRAYSAECPHMGCPVSVNLEKGIFECPCHGSIFNLATGERISGPAPEGLRKLEFKVEKGEIFI